MTWIRAVFAAGLSIILPGAGHALLRDWARALLFGGLFLSAFYVFLPTGEIAAAGSITELRSIAEGVDTMSQFALSFIILFATIDAGFRAFGFAPNGNSGDEGPSCPSCGKPLDEDLEFCHWCTTRLEPEPGAEEA
ncbi:zinc ribbon domain-containing protein [Halobacteria archaeon AArc-dxtr1]|nr:zinc ribbon domain-containing protein [Halobacteria archaeon AArc-dxtr1]